MRDFLDVSGPERERVASPVGLVRPVVLRVSRVIATPSANIPRCLRSLTEFRRRHLATAALAKLHRFLHMLCTAPVPRAANWRLDCSAATPPSPGVALVLLGIELMVSWTSMLSAFRVEQHFPPADTPSASY
jgi:hypothetical protein